MQDLNDIWIDTWKMKYSSDDNSVCFNIQWILHYKLVLVDLHYAVVHIIYTMYKSWFLELLIHPSSTTD